MSFSPDSSAIVMDATRDNFHSLMKFIEEFLIAKDIPQPENNNILLACEEILVNIIDYAYGENTGPVWLKLSFHDNKLTIKFTDNGKPFNPLLTEKPDIGLPLEERSIGGLGIFIVKNLTDDVSYEHINGQNQLTLAKNINRNKSQEE